MNYKAAWKGCCSAVSGGTERNALLSSLYQNQSYLRHLQKLTGAQDDVLLGQMDRLIVAAIDTPTPRSVVKQLDAVMPALPLLHANPLISGILNDFNQSCISWSRSLRAGAK